MDASKLHFQAVMVTLQTRPSPSSKKKAIRNEEFVIKTYFLLFNINECPHQEEGKNKLLH